MISKTWQFFKSSPIFLQISHWKFKIENKIIMGGMKRRYQHISCMKKIPLICIYCQSISLDLWGLNWWIKYLFLICLIPLYFFWRECDNMYLGRTTNFLSNDSGVDDVLSPPASIRNTHSLIRFEINWWFWQY